VKESDPARKDLKKKGADRINKDVGVFAFFLFLAFVFWYLNSLGKETEAGIKYSVKYTNLPNNRSVSNDSRATVNLFLKGKGSSILKLKLSGNKAPVAIDISKVNYKRMHGSREFNYFIVTSGLTKSLTVQLGSGFEITSIKPDTLFFTLEKTTSKSAQDVSADNKSNGGNANAGILK
jgi:hypothetical protein